MTLSTEMTKYSGHFSMILGTFLTYQVSLGKDWEIATQTLLSGDLILSGMTYFKEELELAI